MEKVVVTPKNAIRFSIPKEPCSMVAQLSKNLHEVALLFRKPPYRVLI